jgi:argininosuccinate synthase
MTGQVKLKLFKGNILPYGIQSPHSLHQPALGTFEEDSVYNQQDSEGFIRLCSAKVYGMVHRKKTNEQ